MNITLINTLYYPNIVGGAERSVQFLAEALVKAKHTVSVICLSNKKHIHQEEINGVKVYYLGLKNIYWPFEDGSKKLKALWHLIDTYNLAMPNEVANVLKDIQPDIVHTNNLAGFSVAVWDTLMKLKLPIIHTLRDYYLLCPRTTMFRNQQNCEKQCLDCSTYSLVKQKRSQQVKVVVGISKFILEKHLKHGYFSSSMPKVIYNPYKAQSKSSGIPTRPLTFGFLGRLSPEKGIEVLLQAITKLSSDAWKLIIGGIGDHHYEARLKQSYSHPNIQFLGFVNPENFLSNVDILIVPSLWHEPMGRIIIEAYAHGIPVVGSRKGGIPELILEGETGFTFDPQHPEMLTKILDDFLNHKIYIEKLNTQCLKEAEKFLPDSILKHYTEAYEQTLA